MVGNVKQIIKRDGRYVNADKQKIIEAIYKAFKEVDGELTEYAVAKANNIADYIMKECEKKTLSVEEIQDLVEKGLSSTKRKDVAKAYILYRDERTRERNKKSVLIREIGEKLKAENVQNQNANVDEYSFGGRRGEAANTLMKQYALDYCMSPMARMNHLSNIIYTHDLDSYAVGMHNCLSIPFDDLLAKGFNTRQTDIRPANSVSTAFQLLAVIFQLQSLQQFGGVSATHLDWTMVPYVRKSFYKHYKDGAKYICDIDNWSFDDILKDINENKIINYTVLDIAIDNYSFYPNEKDDMGDFDKVYKYAMDKTIKETEQAVEGMYHNLNTLQSRSGNQLPFTSINYGTCTATEGRVVTKALLEGSLKGVGKLHKTPIFPCGIFQSMKGVNQKPGDANYDLFQLALKSTSKRLYPNYANVDWSGNEGYDKNDPRTYFSTMGCRTANGFDINGFGQLKDGRGNIAPVTIIMPTLAMMAKEKAKELEFDSKATVQEIAEATNTAIIDNFMALLSQKIDEAKDQLIERFEYICSQPAESAKFMYENGVMAGYIPEEGIRSALKHGTLAVGQLGLAETLQILIGCDHTEPEGLELAHKIESLFKEKCMLFKKKYKLNFGVYFTPAENLCYTAMTKFKKQYGEIPNVSDKSFFTNSMHVPVWRHLNPIDKIKIESELTGYSSAGCITYVELDSNCEDNLKVLESLVINAMEHDIPYFAINVPSDTCLECGYTDEFEDKCPICGSTNLQHLRRVTGYLTGNYTTAFNPGKQEEVKMRYRHSKEWDEWKQK